MSQTLLDLAHPLAMYPGDHWVLQDANYNVLGLVARDGKLVERYEYSPYGERKVFVSAGTNDPGCYVPTLISSCAADFGFAEEADDLLVGESFLHKGLS